MIVTKPPKDARIMVHRGHVDHADANQALGAGADPVGPAGKIAGKGQNLTSVLQNLAGGRSQHSTPAFPVEQGDTDPPFELGQPLRQGRRAHPDPIGGLRPGG